MSATSPLLNESTIAHAVTGLDRWFDAMRTDWPTQGYGGPVVHWWNHALAYCGTGLDWRYEGIIDGYLSLWRRTGRHRWLAKAIRAGEDLVNGQTPTGTFRNSRFERNPGDGGTPHEAACDVALLRLAEALASAGDSTGSARYHATAARNIDAVLLGVLWDDHTATLRDGADGDTFVPNKAATAMEAILLYAVNHDVDLVERVASPTGDRILAMQVRRRGSPLDGAIAQNRVGGRVVNAYFPLYVARCVPPLLMLARRTGDRRYATGAVAAAAFVARCREGDGGLPQVVYANGRVNRFPRWIAGSGDIARCLAAAANEAPDRAREFDPAPTICWMLNGVRPDGRIATAEGFGRVAPWASRADRRSGEIGVVGWCDKAFRHLAATVDPAALDPDPEPAVSRPEPFAFGRIVR